MGFVSNGYGNYQNGYGGYQQGMTPPIIRAEIVQVDGEKAAANYPVGAGASQMMIARDDSAIYIKTMTNSGPLLEIYDRRPPVPPPKPFVPEEYVRKDEIAAIVAELRRREAAENEPV